MAPHTPPEARSALQEPSVRGASAEHAALRGDEQAAAPDGPPVTPAEGAPRPGRLERIAELGQGGSGQVWLVYDHERRHELALKRVADRHPDQLRRFKRSFRALCALHHPNLVRLYEIGEDAEGLYLLMEAVHGVPLLRYLRQPGPLTHDLDIRPEPGDGESVARTSPLLHPTDDLTRASGAPFPSEVAVSPPPLHRKRFISALQQLVEGLGALHAAHQVHRDLKPSNVLVTRDGYVKLLDFGIVASAGHPDPGQLCGTIGFVPPEALRGANPDPAADIYALGVLLHQAWTGRLPFRGDRQAVLRQTLHQHPPAVAPIAPWVPAGQAELIDRMLLMDPLARPTLPEVREILRETFSELQEEFPSQPSVSVALHSPPGQGAAEARRGLEEPIARVLDRLLHPQVGLLLIDGRTGSGKGRFLGLVQGEAEAAGYGVLRGCARPGDRVPFSAFDEILDRLGQVLRHVPDTHWTLEAREAVEVAGGLFPSLRPSGWTGPPRLPERAVVFTELARLLAWTGARRRGLLILIEDLHHADEDCVDLLDALLAADLRHVQLVASLSTERFGPGAPNADPGARLLRRHPARVERLQLTVAARDEVLRTLRRKAGSGADTDALEAIAEACEGHTDLAAIAGQWLQRDPTLRTPEALWRRHLQALWKELGEPCRDLVTLCLAADRPLTFAQACACLHLPFRELYEAAARLEPSRLVEVEGAPAPETRLRFPTKLFRAELRTLAGPERLRRIFRALSANLPQSEAIARVRYLREAGEGAAAAELAHQAAREAMDRAAFHLAAELLELASLDGPLDPALLQQWAICLEACGRYGPAARIWERMEHLQATSSGASTGWSAPGSSLRHARIAALLADNRRDEAIALIEEEDEAIGGSRRIRLRILYSMVRFFLGGRAPTGATTRQLLPGPPRTPRLPAASGEPGTRLAQETLRAEQRRRLRLGLVITHFDPGRAVHMLLEACDVGRRAGDGSEAFARMLLAYIASHMNSRAGGLRLCRRYHAQAEQAAIALHGAERQLYHRLRTMVDGHLQQRAGRWQDAIETYGRLATELDHNGEVGSFQRVLVTVHTAICALLSQDIPAVRAASAELHALLENRGSHVLAGHARFLDAGLCGLLGSWSEGVAHLEPWKDMDPRACRTATDAWGVTQQRIRSGFGSVEAAAEALPHIRKAMRVAARFHVLRQVTAPMLTVPAAMLEMQVLRGGLPGGSARRARRLANSAIDAPPGMGAAALRCLAYLADHAGRPERAVALLKQSEALARHLGQPLDQAVAHYQLGRRVAGTRGDAMMDEARRALEEAHSTGALLHEDPGPPGRRS